ncbi:hypothetical protein UFOVP905_46 [uncultured Caudovirales phage]|uniref:Uncharacterized protein n=1 Tax=uncultured Caudovirales phage TaxID=2100421 RepID=A0A6J5SFW5_9CAUD|nr:hypothetical protein UFOVP905_46 [uncultured Caudovirales phage]CAB4212820.1 hypothetical protein UFOVP1432_41 [uncultured Caudovirales phage]
MNEERRSSDTKIALLAQALDNMQMHIAEREVENKLRIEKLEKEVTVLKSDRAKLSGGMILITAVGGAVIWVLTFGEHIIHFISGKH